MVARTWPIRAFGSEWHGTFPAGWIRTEWGFGRDDRTFSAPCIMRSGPKNQYAIVRGSGGKYHLYANAPQQPRLASSRNLEQLLVMQKLIGD